MAQGAERQGDGRAADDHETVLTIWTIYFNPKDYPRKFVLRPHYVGGKQEFGAAAVVADSLDEARRYVPPGLVMMPRTPQDDVVIVETWM